MAAVRLEPERLAAPGGLVSTLLERADVAQAFFPHGMRRVAMTTPPAPTGVPSRLPAEAFICTGSEAESRLQAVLSGGGLAVTTGQQPQLFGGPLYVLYKALTAARAALELEAEIGVPCLAVFWVASDDHDWSEVASVRLLDADGNARSLAVPAPSGGERRPVGPTLLPSAIGDVTAEFCTGLETRAEGESWTEMLHEAYRPGRTFTEAFVDVLRGWVGDLPMAILDPTLPAVRASSASFLGRVLEEHANVEEALRQGTEIVEGAGFRPQLTYLEGASPVFREEGDGRHRLYSSNRGFRVAKGGPELATLDVKAELDSAPERYSPAAALRPVLESHLLPVGITVLGPGEIAYWAQLRPLFEALSTTMPVVEPRASWRILEPRVERLLEKTGVSADQLEDGGATAATSLVERSRPRHIEEALLRLESRTEEGFDSLDEATRKDMPGLRSAVGKARSHAFAALAGFRKAVDSDTRQRHEVSIGQVQRAARNLYPGGVPQERAVSPFVYLARYGGAFLADVYAAHHLGLRSDVNPDDGAVAGDSGEA